jgi:hypothetical protein
LEESGRGLILRYYPGIHLDELRKSSKNFRIANLEKLLIFVLDNFLNRECPKKVTETW